MSECRDCRDLEPMLAPYVDGAAEPRTRAAVDEHIGACPPCRDRVAAERAAREVLAARRDRLRACASERLRQRCTAHRAAASAAPSHPSPRSFLRRTVVPLAMAASLLLVVGTVIFLGLNRGVELFAAQLAVDHVKCHHFSGSADTRPDPILLSQEWKRDRGWALDVPGSAPQYGLELITVRRCGSTEGANAHILYRWHGQPLSVYVMNSESSLVPTRIAQAVHKAGQDLVFWREQGRTYAVVGHGSPSELAPVVQYVKLSARTR